MRFLNISNLLNILKNIRIFVSGPTSLGNPRYVINYCRLIDLRLPLSREMHEGQKQQIRQATAISQASVFSPAVVPLSP